MKISIITVCYNSANTIRDAILSVAGQDYKNVEHIIVDGGSVDGTMDIVRSSTTVTKYISEADNGIYDAMNKGLSLATGDIVGILNSDDVYFDTNILTTISKVFDNSKIDACYSDLVYVDKKDLTKVVRYWQSTGYKNGLFRSGWMPAHPTFFVRNEIYKKYGNFRGEFRLAADFEILFRFIERYKINTIYIPRVTIRMRTGGATNKSLKNIVSQNIEIISILKEQYQKVSIFSFLLRKLGSRLLQFSRRPPLNS